MGWNQFGPNRRRTDKAGVLSGPQAVEELIVSDHIAVDELADAAAGMLDRARAREIDAHVEGCSLCSAQVAGLEEVSGLLNAEPRPAMPPEVSRRLNQVLAAESQRRAANRTATQSRDTLVRPRLKPTLGTFGHTLPKPSRARSVSLVLAACAAAGMVGFAGYFLSASAGLNEPTATSPAVVSTDQLGAEAREIRQSSDLSPHRFSQAWECARVVTSGRITAITPVLVDRQPALLVYTKEDGIAQVTVVTGCGSGKPSAGPSTTLPR